MLVILLQEGEGKGHQVHVAANVHQEGLVEIRCRAIGNVQLDDDAVA